MSITTPTFYPQPWAANEQLVPLTQAEMAAGYPSGDDQKPSRQSINNALQYSVNGVLYYLTMGIPAWSTTAEYQMGAIVAYGGRYYASLFDGNIDQPAAQRCLGGVALAAECARCPLRPAQWIGSVRCL